MKNKKNILKILVVIVGILLIIGVAYAADYYRLNHNSTKKIDKYNTCLKNTSSNDYFIPTKTSTEWNSLKSHLPSGVSIVKCPLTRHSDGNNYWEIRYQYKDRTSAHPTCGSIPRDALIVQTPFGSHFSRESNAERISSVVINGVRVYKSNMVNSNYGACSPLYNPARRRRAIKY